MDKTKRNAVIIGIIAFGYYLLLLAKQWTWTFTGVDSADWLTASIWWSVPQPYGSPLYIATGHLLNAFSGDLVLKMGIFLSALPAAITVAFMYLIAKELTGKEKIAIVCATVLLGCGVFLSQSTIIEEYSFAIMFLTISYWFYIKGNRLLTTIFLGLAGAVHIICVALAVLWIGTHYKEYKSWLKYVPVYFVFGLLPYSLILAMMYFDTPRTLAGHLSLQGINSYLGSTGTTVGGLSIVEVPERMWNFVTVVLLSFGVGILPMVYGLKRPWKDNRIRLIVVTVGFILWLYLTNWDFTTWTFLCFCLPLAIAAIAIGLNKLKSYHTAIVGIGACILIILNGFFLNANTIVEANPRGVRYYDAMWNLPDGTAVVTTRGGPYGFGLTWVIAQGKFLRPLFMTDETIDNSETYQDYTIWLTKNFEVKGDNVLEQTQYCLDNKIPVLMLTPMLTPRWVDRFTITNTGDEFFETILACEKELPTREMLRIEE